MRRLYEQCEHKWGKTEAYFQGPAGAAKTRNLSEEMLERMIWGITTITQECEKCGKMHSYIVTGKAPIPGRKYVSAG